MNSLALVALESFLTHLCLELAFKFIDRRKITFYLDIFFAFFVTVSRGLKRVKLGIERLKYSWDTEVGTNI